jgi:sortase (surface protein transpeptidase)
MDPVLLNIYYQQNPEPARIIPARVRLSAAQILRKLALWATLVGILIFAVLYLPSFVYKVLGDRSNSYLLFRKNSDFVSTSSPQVKVDDYQPRLDSTLPLENQIIIPSVGINTKINEASFETYEDALKVGVWRVPDFGTPYERKAPVILAAHRYGYLKWSVPYRLKNSFYNLPKVKVGDTVEIVWRQRKYIYEVYAEGKGEEITDYSADLILYTCESLTSPIRIFKYARLLRV